MNIKNKSSLAKEPELNNRITAEGLFDAAGIKADNIDTTDLNCVLFEIQKNYGNRKYPDSVIRAGSIAVDNVILF